MKSGKGEGDGYRKEKKYGSGYMYFSYICNPALSCVTLIVFAHASYYRPLPQRLYG